MNIKSPKADRTKGKTVAHKDVKYQSRIFLSLSWKLDLLPVWWKYYSGATQQQKGDRMSYGFKWLIISINFENTKMKRRQ